MLLVRSSVLVRALGVLLVIGIGLGACRAPGDGAEPDAGVEAAGASESVRGQSYAATGVVRSVTPSGSHAVIAHDDIPGFMDAMTMPFPVAAPEVMEGVVPGDTIGFRFTVGPDGILLRQVEAADDAAGEAARAAAGGERR